MQKVAPLPQIDLLDPQASKQQLDLLRCQIGSYWWLWAILRLRSRQIKGFFPNRLFDKLLPYCRSSKPYFIGQMSDGTRFVGDLHDRYSAGCGLDKGYEGELIALLKKMADQHPGSFVDVGANQGAVAASVGRHIGSGRKLIAFEPIPLTATRAAATFALNGLTNASLLPIAVGDVNEKITFYCSAGRSDISSAARDLHAEGCDISMSVECRTLDSLMATVLQEKAGVIKIDVEGFEPQVVKGASALIKRDRPAIMFEYVPELAGPIGWNAQDVADLIMQAGGSYSFETYLRDEPIGFPPQRDTGVLNVMALPR